MTPPPSPTTPRTVAEAQELVSFAAQYLGALERAEAALAGEPETLDAQSWLAAARRRIGAARDATLGALAAAAPLPELEAERNARGQALFEQWVSAAEALLEGIGAALSLQSPLIEVLFPHQRFDKLRRGGNAARAYKADLERRRASSYVVRLAGEPEYAFLPPLLAKLDRARDELAEHEAPITLDEADLDALRAAVASAATALARRLAEARLLAEAALFEREGGLSAFGLDEKPRRLRALRAATDK